MKFIKAGFEILTDLNNAIECKRIEVAARTCKKSEHNMTESSAEKMVDGLINVNHMAMIEHANNLSVRFTVDRGVTHEIVRHRLASFAQESTRYCNYSKKGMMFIIPCWFAEHDQQLLEEFNSDMDEVHEYGTRFDYQTTQRWFLNRHVDEKNYNYFVQNWGWSPQQARCELPHCVKSEIVVTANLREWMHILEQRTKPDCHPQMQEVMVPLKETLQQALPTIFGGI